LVKQLKVCSRFEGLDQLNFVLGLNLLQKHVVELDFMLLSPIIVDLIMFFAATEQLLEAGLLLYLFTFIIDGSLGQKLLL
jgi:hypothetical protein